MQLNIQKLRLILNRRNIILPQISSIRIDIAIIISLYCQCVHEIAMKTFRIQVLFFYGQFLSWKNNLVIIGAILCACSSLNAADVPTACLETYQVENCGCPAGNQVTATVNGAQVTFKINCLKDNDLPDCSENINCYMFFWDFGDGQYGCGLTNSTSLSYTHTYTHTGDFSPRLIVTKRYTNSDPPPSEEGNSQSCTSADRQQVWQPININSISLTDSVIATGDTCMLVTPIHFAYGNEDIWHVISFTHNPSDFQAGMIEMTYDPDKFEYLEYTYYSPTGISSALELTQTLGELSWKWDNTLENPPAGPYNIFVKFHTEPDATGSYSFTGSYIDSLGNECSNNAGANSVGPKDPNEKFVDIKYTNIIGPEELEYTIFFYNIGEGPAERITIHDEISPMLDLCHFNMKSVKINGTTTPVSFFNNSYFCPDIDPVTRMVTWEWNFMDIPGVSGLHGLYEPGRGYKNPNIPGSGSMLPRDMAEADPSTSIEIKFTIKTNCTFEFGDVIENEAKIQFENLDWFTTDPARTVKVCCDTANHTTRPAGIPFLLTSLDPSIPPNIVLDSGSVIFDSGLPTDTIIGNDQYYIYPSTFDSLDRVMFRVCDSLNPAICITIEKFLCIYDPASPPSGCPNTPCEDITCPIIKPWWDFSGLSLPVILSILLGLFLLILVFRRIFRRL